MWTQNIFKYSTTHSSKIFCFGRGMLHLFGLSLICQRLKAMNMKSALTSADSKILKPGGCIRITIAFSHTGSNLLHMSQGLARLAHHFINQIFYQVEWANCDQPTLTAGSWQLLDHALPRHRYWSSIIVLTVTYYYIRLFFLIEALKCKTYGLCRCNIKLFARSRFFTRVLQNLFRDKKLHEFNYHSSPICQELYKVQASFHFNIFYVLSSSLRPRELYTLGDGHDL